MQKKSSTPLIHIAFSSIVVLVLALVFGRSWGNNMAALYFVSMLLPIVLGTAYFVSYYLVPKYLLQKRYAKFALYSLYTAIISVYLEMIVLMFSFIYIGNFSFRNLGPNASDTILLAVILYMLVFIGVLLLMMQTKKETRQALQELLADKEKMKNPYLEIMSNRKMARIPYSDIVYIESLSDYIRVNTLKEQITSKEKISNLASRLPDMFLRIHRSFIINKEKITSISYDEISVDDIQLNIGRSYRKVVKEALKDDPQVPGNPPLAES